MSSAKPLSENPEENEIDRLLTELGIELPAVEDIAGFGLPTGNANWSPIVDSNEPHRDTHEADNFWSVHSLKMTSRQEPPEVET